MTVIIDKAWREAIDAQLKKQGISRSAFARMLGINPQTVTDYLNGRVAPGSQLMERWAQMAGLHELTISFEEEPRPTAKRA